jgi:SAM-dependent methyltransferase
MLNYKKIIQKIKFDPPWWAIINPFFFARKNLNKYILKYSHFLKGELLDVGCGSKPYEKLFVNCNKYVGLELESQKKDSKADYFYNGTNFPFEDNKFDSIFCSQVLEHVFEPEIFLSEINRVMKKDGLIILTLPFIWDEHEQPYDYARYSSFGLNYLIKKQGFEVVNQIKTCNNFTVIIQIINCYIYKKLCYKKFFLLKVFGFSFVLFLNFFGILLSVLPKNNDLYLDNFILARKK